jgi:predicted negative regulator of RcsB-dependent stress response
MSEIRENAENIENKSWRDKVLRELAKAYTHEGYENKAIELIDEIQTPDTKAMTIRGIGMAAADNQWQNTERYNKLFKNLSSAAEKIDHPPSHAIAYTYIAMSQAFAGDNMGAMATAKAMENDALRHKAFGETAEIQAERGEFDEAMKSIAQIESEAFKNKAYGIIAGIFIQNGKLDEAYEAGQKITNAYVRTQVFQNIVNYDNEEENFKSKNASN